MVLDYFRLLVLYPQALHEDLVKNLNQDICKIFQKSPTHVLNMFVFKRYIDRKLLRHRIQFRRIDLFTKLM